MWLFFFCAGFYIVFTGGQRFWAGDITELISDGKITMQRVCQREFARCLYPGLFLEYEEDSEPDSLADWYIQRVLTMHPLYKLQHGAEQLTAMENAATYEMLISGGVHDENEVDENGQEYDMEALQPQVPRTTSRSTDRSSSLSKTALRLTSATPRSTPRMALSPTKLRQSVSRASSARKAMMLRSMEPQPPNSTLRKVTVPLLLAA